MTPTAGPPGSTDDPPSRPGRKLGPISETVGTAHRAWLEPVRDKYFTSGLTVSDLARRAGWSKSKVSELLRGAGLYPSWELTYGLLHVLGLPAWPMRRLWSAAALEASKKQEWVDGSIEKVVLSTGPELPPVDHRAFTDFNREAYLAYTGVFLPPAAARHVVDEVFDILWLRWEEALVSANPQKFAWQVLRASVMARTPHSDGHPQLGHAAFETVALRQAARDQQFTQIEESLALFQAIGRLPALQLDVVVLMYLRGMSELRTANVLGVPTAFIGSVERHAKRSLTTALDLGETHP
ncbi:helix-turn-helix domain-containing protein [Streptomyces sp. NPDC029704]|uniref:helix-turn-helix domain-containing protein n=1 Tax=Streptomyces sp. NPDC029704 TaxID=3156920 RepID=UPI0033F30AB7